MKTFFTIGENPIEEKNCTAIDVVLEHIIIRVRTSGVDVFDVATKEIIYSKVDSK